MLSKNYSSNIHLNKNDNIHKNEVQNIGFGIPIEFLSQKRKKNYSNQSRNNEIWLLWSRQSFGESTISNLESQSKFQVKEEKSYSNRSRNNEIGLLWSGQSFWESTISNIESPLNFQVKKNLNTMSLNWFKIKYTT